MCIYNYVVENKFFLTFQIDLLTCVFKMESKVKGIGCKHEKLLTGSYFHRFSKCVFILRLARFGFLSVFYSCFIAFVSRFFSA